MTALRQRGAVRLSGAAPPKPLSLDDDPEAADHWMAEHRGKHQERKQGHAEDQDQRRPVMQQPSPLAARNQKETGFGLKAS
jgi:hypothetical protein